MARRPPTWLVIGLPVFGGAAVVLWLWTQNHGNAATTPEPGAGTAAAATGGMTATDLQQRFADCQQLPDYWRLIDDLEKQGTAVGPALLDQLQQRGGEQIATAQRELYDELLLVSGAAIYGDDAWLLRLRALERPTRDVSRWLGERLPPKALETLAAHDARYEPMIFTPAEELRGKTFAELMAALQEDQSVIGLADLAARGSLGMGRLRAARGDASACALLLDKALHLQDEVDRRASLDALPAEWKQKALKAAAAAGPDALQQLLSDLASLPAEAIGEPLARQAMAAATDAHLEPFGLAVRLKLAAGGSRSWVATEAVWQPLSDDTIRTAWLGLDPLTQAHLLYAAAAESVAAPQDAALQRVAAIGGKVLTAFLAARSKPPFWPRDLSPYPLADWPQVEAVPEGASAAAKELVSQLQELRPSLLCRVGEAPESRH